MVLYGIDKVAIEETEKEISEQEANEFIETYLKRNAVCHFKHNLEDEDPTILN